MGIYMIGTLYKNKQLIGVRLFDTSKEKSGVKMMDVPTQQVVSVLLNNQLEIKNLGLDGTNLVGTNGVMDRYTKIDLDTRQAIEGKTPIVIVNQIGDAGYTLVDYNGNIKKARNSDALIYAKKLGVANGKVVIKDSLEFISSISGEYEVEKVSRSKLGDAKMVKAGMVLTTGNDTSTVAKHARIDVSNEISENDVFKAMTPMQKNVIKEYYLWYTVDIYKSLAKSVRLSLDTAKAEKLADIRGDVKWVFIGIADAGWRGASRCSLGHPIRYEYWAAPEGEEKNDDAKIIFGIDCSGDFFNISPENMKHLITARKTMSIEIAQFADMLANGMCGLYNNKISLFYDILKKLGDLDKIRKIFGDQIAYTLVNFMEAELPFPKSLIKLCTKKIKTYGTKEFIQAVFPEYKELVSRIYYKPSKIAMESEAITYLQFIATNKIEGDYAYDPLDKDNDNKNEGKYNKETREVRRRLNRRLRVNCLCSEFSMAEIQSLLSTIDILQHVYFKIRDYADEVQVGNPFLIDRTYREFMLNKPTGYNTAVEKQYTALFGMLYTMSSSSCDRDTSVQLRDGYRYKFKDIHEYYEYLGSEGSILSAFESFKFYMEYIRSKNEAEAERERQAEREKKAEYEKYLRAEQARKEAERNAEAEREAAKRDLEEKAKLDLEEKAKRDLEEKALEAERKSEEGEQLRLGRQRESQLITQMKN